MPPKPTPPTTAPTDSNSAAIRILCIHGVGHQEGNAGFENDWRTAIAAGLKPWDPGLRAEIEFVKYDALFAQTPLTTLDTIKAVAKLGASGIVHWIGDQFRRERGFGQMRDAVRWSAGMVVQWAEHDELRREARKIIRGYINTFKPDVVLAHSLGSLLSYDTFGRPDGQALLAGRTFVTFGSQIGNPFVRSTLGGRIQPLGQARKWFHLFNPHDDAFTASLRIPKENFEQVDATFDIAGILDHDARQYLAHPNTVSTVWRNAAVGPAAPRGANREISISARVLRPRAARPKKPQRRALLVGINEYPNPADRLEGCVNDVFLMSEVLQETGFAAENIRVVLNDRATAAAIRERLEWLLEGSDDERDRVFYYSGHGAQIPGYGTGETVDRKDECLVPVDFDWTAEHAVTDDQFFDLYSQLSYKTHFLTILDCCHSGGMTREGGTRVRGLAPPDDIRHREMRWDPKLKAWISRSLKKAKPDVTQRSRRPAMFGEEGDLNRLGRSADLRASTAIFHKACREFKHDGPFMPIILQACEEKQLAYEYRHGVQSYGAFTYFLASTIRAEKAARRKPSWGALVKQVAKKMSQLQNDQQPCLVCPTALKGQKIPWAAK